MASKSKHNALVFAILEYLQDVSKEEGVDSESLEVASQCLSSEFGLDLNNVDQQNQYSVRPLSLPAIFSLGTARKQEIEDAIALKTNEKVPEQKLERDIFDLGDPQLNTKFQKFIQYAKEKNVFASVQEGSPEWKELIEKVKVKFLESQKKEEAQPVIDVQKAESFKVEGNAHYSQKNYQQAVEAYTKAIQHNPENTIYYCNRAAAYSYLNFHEKALEDSRISAKKDAKYSKAFNRIGASLFSLGKYREAIEEGYRKALELDPNNQSYKDALEIAEEKLREVQTTSRESSTEGAPNFADILNNPAVRNMAQNMGQFPGFGAGAGGGMPNLASMMSDPSFLQTAQQMMSQPGMSELLNDPSIRNMAQNLMQNPDQLNQMLQGLGGLGGFPGGGGGGQV